MAHTRMKTNVMILMDAKFILPTLQVYKHYFDEQYPCNNESNDGTSMCAEDELKFQTYNHLLGKYLENRDLYLDLHNQAINKIKVNKK
jgi:hypothetical protein